MTSAGVLSPHAASVIVFNPPLNLEEVQPMLLTINGTGAITMHVMPGSIRLENKTTKHAPYVLVLTPKLNSLDAIFTAIRNRLGGIP